MHLNQLRNWLDQQFNRLFANELVRRIVKNSGYLFGTTGVSAAASMLQGILAARLLGAAGFGTLGSITLFTSVVNNLISFRMGELVVKYVGHHTEHADPQNAAATFKLAALVEVLASCIAFGIVVVLAPLAAVMFTKDAQDAPLFIFYGLVLLANLIAESSTGLLQIFDRFRRLAGLGIVQSLTTLALIFITFLMDGGLRGVLAAYMVGKSIGALGISIAALIEAQRRWGAGWWKTPLTPLRPKLGEMGRFAVSTNISSSISLFTKDSELLWVSWLRGPTEAGYYKLALALANMVQMPVDPLPQATYPELSRQVARSQWNSVRDILRQGSYLAGGYALAATLFLVAFGQPLISLLYSPEFLPSYPALLILLAGLLVANTYYWRRIALLALGRADFPAKVNAILAGLKVIGTLIFVPRYGYLASAALLAGFYWAGSFISAFKTHSLIKQKRAGEGLG